MEKLKAFIWTHALRNPEYVGDHNIEAYGANMADQFPV